MSEEKHLCAACVGEDFLRAKINECGGDATCTYCGRGGKTFSLSEIADEIEIALQEHFCRTPTEPSDLERLAMQRVTGVDREGEPIADIIGSRADRGRPEIFAASEMSPTTGNWAEMARWDRTIGCALS
jgi:hypothetical protein